MKLNIFAYYNKTMCEFTNPIIDDHDSDIFKENVKHALVYAVKVRDDNNLVSNLSYCILYHLGTYDNATGIFDTSKPVELFDCEKFLSEIAEVSKDEN